MTKSKAAFTFACRTLGKTSQLYMWTFTFKDVIPVKETRKRWNYLLTLLQRTWPKLCGIRVFELHPGGHGLHVHLVTNSYIRVEQARLLAEKAGWGRIHVKRVPSERIGYLGKYLTKKRPECLKRWRLWAGFGKGWEWTRCKDVVSNSLFSTIYRACKEWQGWTGRGNFFVRVAFVWQMMFMTIENGWKPGLGPDDKPYWMCCPEELDGFDPPDYDAPF